MEGLAALHALHVLPRKPMAFVHSITTINSSDGATLLGRPISEPDYAVDIGFMADSLVDLLAEIQGVDPNANYEALMAALEADHQEAEAGDEFVSILSSEATNSFATGLGPIIDRAVEILRDTELPEMTPEQIRGRLETLQQWCATAASAGEVVAFHSYE